jgi:hypothetical protein
MAGPLPAEVAAAYTRVLGILQEGRALKDDTYLAHLTDRTVEAVTNTDHLHQLGLLPLLLRGLAPAGPLLHLRPFLLRLAAALLPRLPALAIPSVLEY